MKKAAVMFLLLLAVCVCIPHGMAADASVRLNGEELHCRGVQPFLSDGVVFVPARALMETMGGQVEWNAAEQGVLLIREEQKLDLQIGNTEATDIWNGSREKTTLPVAPRLIDGCTMVPLRAVAEVFYADVVWDAAHQTVHITAPRDIPVEIPSKELADAIRELHYLPENAPILERHLAQISSMEICGNRILLTGSRAMHNSSTFFVETYEGLEKLAWIRHLNIELRDEWNLSELLRLPRLTYLSIYDFRQTKDNWNYYLLFSQNPRIEGLHLFRYGGPMDFRGMTGLRSLSLRMCASQDMSNLPFEQLEYLNISGVTGDADFNEKEYDLSGLEKAQNLECLRLDLMNISDIDLL